MHPHCDRLWSDRLVRSPLVRVALLAAAFMLALAPMAVNHAVSDGEHRLLHSSLTAAESAATSCSHSAVNAKNEQALPIGGDRPDSEHDKDSCPICHLVVQIRQATITTPTTSVLAFLSTPVLHIHSIEATSVDPSDPHLPSHGPRAPPILDARLFV